MRSRETLRSFVLNAVLALVIVVATA